MADAQAANLAAGAPLDYGPFSIPFFDDPFLPHLRSCVNWGRRPMCAQYAHLDRRQPLASPTLMGIPTV